MSEKEDEKAKYHGEITLGVVWNEMQNLRQLIEKIEQKLDKEFVTHTEFWPVKAIAYGAAGIILTGAFIALIGLVVK